MKEVIMQVQSHSIDYPKALIYVGDLVCCKDCRHWYEKMNKCNRCPSISGNWEANDFCSYGERKKTMTREALSVEPNEHICKECQFYPIYCQTGAPDGYWKACEGFVLKDELAEMKGGAK